LTRYGVGKGHACKALFFLGARLLRLTRQAAAGQPNCPQNRGNQPFFARLAGFAALPSASMRARSSAFSSRAFSAIVRTASNSSRVTRSRSAIQRSIQPFMAVSASVRAPCATPIALVIRRDRSSRNLFGAVMGGLLPERDPAYMLSRRRKLKVDFAAPARSLGPRRRDAGGHSLSRHLERTVLDRHLRCAPCAALVCAGLYCRADRRLAHHRDTDASPRALAGRAG